MPYIYSFWFLGWNVFCWDSQCPLKPADPHLCPPSESSRQINPITQINETHLLKLPQAWWGMATHTSDRYRSSKNSSLSSDINVIYSGLREKYSNRNKRKKKHRAKEKGQRQKKKKKKLITNNSVQFNSIQINLNWTVCYNKVICMLAIYSTYMKITQWVLYYNINIQMYIQNYAA